jgi:hypothetical protein
MLIKPLFNSPWKFIGTPNMKGKGYIPYIYGMLRKFAYIGSVKALNKKKP